MIADDSSGMVSFCGCRGSGGGLRRRFAWGFGHGPCGEPCGAGGFAFEFADDEGFDAGHVGGSVEDAESATGFGGGDFPEFAEGDFVSVLEDGRSGIAFERGGGAFCLIEHFGEGGFEFGGGVAAEEHAEDAAGVEFCGGAEVGIVFVVLGGHGFGPEGHHGFAAGFLEGGEFFGGDVGVDEIGEGVIDFLELEREFEQGAHGLLEEADGVGAAFCFWFFGRLLGFLEVGGIADEFVEDGVVLREAGIEVFVVGGVGDVDGSGEIDGGAVGEGEGAEGDFESGGRFVFAEADVVGCGGFGWFGGFAGWGR